MYYFRSSIMKRIVFALISASMVFAVGAPRAQQGPGKKILRYGILDYSRGKKKTVIAKRPDRRPDVHFAPRYQGQEPREILINVKRAYNSVHYTSAANAGKSPARVRLRVKAPPGILMGVNGIGGEKLITIPPGSHASLPIKIFTQDAKPGLHDFSMEIVNASNKVLDRVKGRIFVRTPEVQVILRPVPSRNTDDALRRTYELINRGDELTDLSLELEDLPGYAMNPRVEHYLLGKGKRLRVEIFPVNTQGRKSGGQVLVRAAGQSLRFPVSMDAPAGKTIQMISLDPIVRLRRKDWYCTNRPIIHLLFNIPYLQRVPIPNPDFKTQLAELKKKGKAFDTNGDGTRDHWQLVRRGRVTAKGDDYDGDGSIDFYRMSDAPKRSLNRGYFKKDGRWFETNLVDAFLVSSFVPMSDAVQVKPHDVDVLLNDKLVSRRKKIVPAGSRVTRLRVDALMPNKRGFSKNKVTVSTSHLPGSHYQVTAQNTLVLHFSTIQIPLLTQKPVKLDTTHFDAAIRKTEAKLAVTENEVERGFLKKRIAFMKKTRDELLKKAALKVRKAVKLRGVQHEGLDLGIYSSELKLRRGRLRGLVRNQAYMGAAYSLTLYRTLPNGRKKRLAVKRFPFLPPFGRRAFSLRVPGHSPRRRYLYRLELKALPREPELELATSNNIAHLVMGPPPSVNGLRSEMRFLAQELGAKEDQLTLVRPAPTYRLKNGLRPYIREPRISDVVLSTPASFPEAVKTPRTFLFDES